MNLEDAMADKKFNTFKTSKQKTAKRTGRERSYLPGGLEQKVTELNNGKVDYENRLEVEKQKLREELEAEKIKLAKEFKKQENEFFKKEQSLKTKLEKKVSGYDSVSERYQVLACIDNKKQLIVDIEKSSLSYNCVSTLMFSFFEKYHKQHYHILKLIIKETEYGRFSQVPIKWAKFLEHKGQSKDMLACIKDLEKDGWIQFKLGKIKEGQRKASYFFTLVADIPVKSLLEQL